MLNNLTTVSYSDSKPPIRPAKLLKLGQNCSLLYSQYTISLFCLCIDPANEVTYALLKWMPNHSHRYKCVGAEYLFYSCDVAMPLLEKMSASVRKTLTGAFYVVFTKLFCYIHACKPGSLVI